MEALATQQPSGGAEAKRCKRCGAEGLRGKAFHRHPGALDGYLNICKDCVRQTKRGAPRLTNESLRANLLANSRRSGECVVYSGTKNQKGYGSVWVGNTHRGAHRVAWEVERGPIPAGLFVCHRCDNPPCCNVNHLFLGTVRDNVRDMWAKGRGKITRILWPGHCPLGHAYDAKNTKRVVRGGYTLRKCRTCFNTKRREKEAAERAANPLPRVRPIALELLRASAEVAVVDVVSAMTRRGRTPDTKSVRRQLLKLAERGILQRVRSGVYTFPKPPPSSGGEGGGT